MSEPSCPTRTPPLDTTCVPVRVVRLGDAWQDIANVYRSPCRRFALLQGPHDLALLDLLSVDDHAGGKTSEPAKAHAHAAPSPVVHPLPPQPHRTVVAAALLAGPAHVSGDGPVLVATVDTTPLMTITRHDVGHDMSGRRSPLTSLYGSAAHSLGSTSTVTSISFGPVWEASYSRARRVDTLVPCDGSGRALVRHRPGETLAWMCAVEELTAWPELLPGPAADGEARMFDLCAPAAVAAARCLGVANAACASLHQSSTLAVRAVLPFPRDLVARGSRPVAMAALGGSGNEYAVLLRGCKGGAWVGCYDVRWPKEPCAAATLMTDAAAVMTMEALGGSEAAVCVLGAGTGELTTMRATAPVQAHTLSVLDAPVAWSGGVQAMAYSGGVLHIIAKAAL